MTEENDYKTMANGFDEDVLTDSLSLQDRTS